MAKQTTGKNIKSDEWQTGFLIGVAFIVLGVIFAYFALSQPKVAVVTESQSIMQTSNVQIAESKSYVNGNTSVSYVNQNNNSSASYPLNLNKCTAEELMTIKGIGESKANSIIAYRDVIGGYTSVEQLKDISGIGDTVYSKILPYVTV